MSMTHKHIAQEFLTMIIGGEIQAAFDKHVSQDFVHHNQYTKPGREELIKGMQGNQDHFPEKQYAIDMIIEDDGRVMVYGMLRFTPEHTGLKVIHILRFADDKIVEMWDLVQEISEDAVNQ